VKVRFEKGGNSITFTVGARTAGTLQKKGEISNQEEISKVRTLEGWQFKIYAGSFRKAP